MVVGRVRMPVEHIEIGMASVRPFLRPENIALQRFRISPRRIKTYFRHIAEAPTGSEIPHITVSFRGIDTHRRTQAEGHILNPEQRVGMFKAGRPAAFEHAAHHAPKEELAYHTEFAEQHHVFRLFLRLVKLHLRTVHIHTERV